MTNPPLKRRPRRPCCVYNGKHPPIPTAVPILLLQCCHGNNSCPPPPCTNTSPHEKPKQQHEEEECCWDCLFTNDARWGKNEQGQQTINGVYVLLEEIGRGSYGRVHLCERRVGDGVDTPWRRFAVKTMSKPRLRRQRDYVNVPSGGMRKVTAEDKVRLAWFRGSWVVLEHDGG